MRWCLALAALFVWAQTGLAQAGVVTGAQVKAAVLDEMARANITGDPKVSEGRRYYACGAALVVAPKYSGSWDTVNVTCPDAGAEWTIMVRTGQVMVDLDGNTDTKPQDKIEVVVLLSSVKKGEVLTGDILKLVEMPRNGRIGSFFRIEDVAGRRTTQSLSAMQPLRARHLEYDWALQQGQLVQITQVLGGLQVSTIGKTLENAQIGDIVQVENVKSGKVISALVKNSKKVTPIANIN
jgi:flagella basal body P-ring formation protein FlgA